MSATEQGNHPPTISPRGLAAVMLKLMRVAPMHGGEVPGGATRLLSGYSSAYLFPIDQAGQQYGLIDTGVDAKAEEILAVLRYKGLDARAVRAIFLTHEHLDHTAGIRQFPEADVYVGTEDRSYLEGTAASDGFLPSLAGKKSDLAPLDPAKLHSIGDGEVVTIGDRHVRAFAVPGHTQGSRAYLIGDTLYAGDAVTYDRSQKAMKPPKPVSFSVPQAVVSLGKLVERFDAEGIVVQTVVPSHSGEGSFDALRALGK